ncbi:GntR family transcriptional regulator [Nocardioides albertanoniae]|uniref:GntR family transcriptional regulator n=1 Tax=Nocardioides albertanoniae TaxID=1175486 RepID=UPI001B86389E|nr:GntR family transcriptional regulator [Nocardioides albertanoniae]
MHRESTASVIARQLRTAIMERSLQPGAQLSETALSAQFGVSRGPLREAMQRLVQEGLLRSEPNRGLFVIELDEADISDVYVARGAVESAAATMITKARVPAALRELRAACDAMSKSLELSDPAALSDADFNFHDVLVQCSGSQRLVRMHQTLIVETRMCLTALEGTYQQPLELVEEHVQIVDAIEAGDVKLAVRRVEQHMDEALRRLVHAEDDDPNYGG